MKEQATGAESIGRAIAERMGRARLTVGRRARDRAIDEYERLAAPHAGAAELEVTVSNRGFRPAQIALRKGETLKVVLISADQEHCFALDALRIEKRVLPGKRTPVETL